MTGNGRWVSNKPKMSGNPQQCGSQVLASGSVAQTAGQDAGVDVSLEGLVLLQHLSSTPFGREMLRTLGGVNYEQGAWLPVLRLLVQIADLEEHGQNLRSNAVIAPNPVSGSVAGQDVVMESGKCSPCTPFPGLGGSLKETVMLVVLLVIRSLTPFSAPTQALPPVDRWSWRLWRSPITV